MNTNIDAILKHFENNHDERGTGHAIVFDPQYEDGHAEGYRYAVETMTARIRAALCGFSTEGVNVFGDKASIDKVKEWHHAAGTIPELKARIAAVPSVASVVEVCRDQFVFYEQSHRAKGTPEADEKAAVNRKLALMCQSALDVWRDNEKDQWSEQIEAAHPTKTKDFRTYTTALDMVSKRRDKYALVDLVNWLLTRSKK